MLWVLCGQSGCDNCYAVGKAAAVGRVTGASQDGSAACAQRCVFSNRDRIGRRRQELEK